MQRRQQPALWAAGACNGRRHPSSVFLTVTVGVFWGCCSGLGGPRAALRRVGGGGINAPPPSPPSWRHLWGTRGHPGGLTGTDTPVLSVGAFDSAPPHSFTCSLIRLASRCVPSACGPLMRVSAPPGTAAATQPPEPPCLLWCVCKPTPSPAHVRGEPTQRRERRSQQQNFCSPSSAPSCPSGVLPSPAVSRPKNR
jgi:hypothetical protein